MAASESSLTPDEVAAMIAHMNDGHADAVLGYVRRFGDDPTVDSARLVALEPTHMLIDASYGGTSEIVKVAFDHTLRDAKDARETLIALARLP